MCGICGFLTPNLPEYDSGRLLINMCDALRRRGPDAEGLFLERGIALGHRRLKVIDPETGAQPMHDEDDRYVIVYNGEIYNYLELETLLSDAGCRFRTASDTEVLLNGLKRFGIDFLAKTNGMFAFALWDRHERRLWLARDRFGVKPLYWARLNGGGIVFASELSAIAASGLAPWDVDAASLSLYLSLSYLPGANSICRGVHRLQPGHWLCASTTEEIRQGEWWNLLQAWREARCIREKSVAQARESFTATLSDAVRIRLRSDVPLGVFLSSGLDSSVVSALMKQFGIQVNSFTISFADKTFDESKMAAETAAALALDHRTEPADISSAENLMEIVEALDEPFADTSIVPMHALCKSARKYVTVALTGDGADELLAGYVTSHADELYSLLGRAPSSLVRLLRRLVFLLPDNRNKINTIFKLKQFLAAYPKDRATAHACWRLLLYPERLRQLFPASAHGHLANVFTPFINAWNEAEGLPDLDRFLYVDYKTWLQDDILFKTDRASMAHGLELRSPFLDYRLFELCAGLPAQLKRRGAQGKILLREAAREFLPGFVMKRPKTGFNAPVGQWLCREWLDMAEGCFRKSTLESAGLRAEPVLSMWERHKTAQRNFEFQLFTILVYILWLERRRGQYGRSL